LELRLDNAPRELVERAQRKDQAAFADLVRRYERMALAMAYSIVGNSSMAGDVAQEAFLRVWQRLGELDDPDRFLGWFGTVIRNLATDQARRKPRELPPGYDNRQVIDPVVLADQMENRRMIHAALLQLDELTRSAMMLRYYEDLTSKQISELLGLSPAAVDMRLSRGRTELKQSLMKLNPNERCRT
jgi:RNA polymerase sigma-70 factor (ECF subfamily)